MYRRIQALLYKLMTCAPDQRERVFCKLYRNTDRNVLTQLFYAILLGRTQIDTAEKCGQGLSRALGLRVVLPNLPPMHGEEESQLWKELRRVLHVEEVELTGLPSEEYAMFPSLAIKARPHSAEKKEEPAEEKPKEQSEEKKSEKKPEKKSEKVLQEEEKKESKAAEKEKPTSRPPQRLVEDKKARAERRQREIERYHRPPRLFISKYASVQIVKGEEHPVTFPCCDKTVDKAILTRMISHGELHIFYLDKGTSLQYPVNT